MMDKMSTCLYTSSPYQMIEPSASAETLWGSQHGSASTFRHQSFDELVVTHGFRRDFTHTPPPGALQSTFDPWVLDGPSCGSPLSTGSSLTASEGVSTPPSYTDQLPLPGYHPHEQQNQLCPDNSTGYPLCRSVTDFSWEPHYTAPNIWNAHSLVPSWTNSVYPGLPLPATEPFVPSMPIMATPVFSLPDPRHRLPSHFATNSAPFKWKDEDSTDESDSESEESNDEYEDSDASAGGKASKPKSRTQTPGLMMSKWNLSGMNTYDRQQSHPFFCPLIGQPDMKGKICNAKFARPEHCRRHVNTVHGEVRGHHCKVPKCERAFSRGDNLRDHYWTHLHRGGRSGKNDKMSLAELKELLGPSEKKLIRKLKQKMAKHKVKQLRVPVRAKL